MLLAWLMICCSVFIVLQILKTKHRNLETGHLVSMSVLSS